MCELEGLEPGPHSFPGRVKFEITDASLRAVAKIGFHYFLVHNERGLRGDEAFFAPIRRFILDGEGNPGQFFPASGPQMALPFGPNEAPLNWCHVLQAGEHGELLFANVLLFLGPRIRREPKRIRLGAG